MRALVIVLRLLPFCFSFRRDARRWLLWGAPAPRDAAFHERRAERLAMAIAGLGPTFVKLAQVFASRADLIPEPYVSALGTLLDSVPGAPFPAVARLLTESLGAPLERVFERFDRTPLASGSLGLVYRARYQGDEVVVKALRPGVERLVERDVAAARRIAGFVYRRWPNPHLRNFRSALEAFARGVHEEMDFRLEAEHGREIGASLAGDPRVVIPRVYPALTRQRVLVMEYVEGVRMDAIGPLVASGEVDPAAVLRTVIQLYVRMMLMDGLFHADPHPGNLLVQRDGRLVLLDFGMVVRVERHTRSSLIRTVLAGIRRDADGVVDGLYALDLVDAGAQRVEIERLVGVLLAIGYSDASTQEAARALAEEVMATLYDWPITLSGEMVYFARAAALVEGIGARWVPAFNSIAFASPVVMGMRREVLTALSEADVRPEPEELAAVLGALAGHAARVVSSMGRDLAALLGGGLAALLQPTPPATAGSAPTPAASSRELPRSDVARLAAPSPETGGVAAA